MVEAKKTMFRDRVAYPKINQIIEKNPTGKNREDEIKHIVVRVICKKNKKFLTVVNIFRNFAGSYHQDMLVENNFIQYSYDKLQRVTYRDSRF